MAGSGFLAATAPALSSCTTQSGGQVDDRWLFGEFRSGSTDAAYDEGLLAPVTLPHCVAPLSWWRWDTTAWEKLWVYRQHLNIRPKRNQRAVVQLDGVLQIASVYLNGSYLGTHFGGYLPFQYEITDRLQAEGNVLAVVVDSAWGANVPPGRPKPWRPRSIDFYQPGGISRTASVVRLPQLYVSTVFAAPADVLSPRRRVGVNGSINTNKAINQQVSVTARLLDPGQDTGGHLPLAEGSVDVPVRRSGEIPFAITLTDLPMVRLWDVDTPVLYTVEVSVSIGGRVVHTKNVRIGFRETRFQRDGFYLNGRRLQLFGLNRHQWFPYVGGAMPDRVQRRDAEILKNDLNCNMVRCSHYPQSEAFLNACDELGLLVWEEAPGWDYIGNELWRNQVLQDVEAMVTRDRNHPSIIVWGTRLNETEDDIAFYTQTRAIAGKLDGTRATTGAVNSDIHGDGTNIPQAYRDPFTISPQVQDVFAFNDYLRPSKGELPTLREPKTDLPYLVSEAVGTLVGSTTYRRTDPARVQATQAMLHASVHDKAMSDPRYSGLLGWCGFDYPSGNYHSVDGMKWPGVCDFFREPKLGAAFYRAQVDPARRIVIEPAFYWDPRTPPGNRAAIWSNCEALDVFVAGQLLTTVEPDRGTFPNLPYPPFVMDIPDAAVRRGDLRVDGRIGQQVVMSRSFSADRRFDTLDLRSDDAELAADGVDTTRVVARVLDRFGAPRPFQDGTVSFTITGPGRLVGDNPLDLTGNGGVGAVWLQTSLQGRGRIQVTAQHQRFPPRSVSIHAV